MHGIKKIVSQFLLCHRKKWFHCESGSVKGVQRVTMWSSLLTDCQQITFLESSLALWLHFGLRSKATRRWKPKLFFILSRCAWVSLWNLKVGRMINTYWEHGSYLACYCLIGNTFLRSGWPTKYPVLICAIFIWRRRITHNFENPEGLKIYDYLFTLIFYTIMHHKHT